MADRIVYAICADDGKFETMTKEQILTAIEQAVENGHVSDPDGAVFSKIKEIRAGQCEQLWVGTEAQFNALNPAPEYGNSVVRVGKDGVLYLCSDDALFSEIDGHMNDNNNPHGVTAKQTGALSENGGVMKGDVSFENSHALQWKTNDGTIIRVRPYAPANVFQITMQNPTTGRVETGVLNIGADGSIYFSKPIAVKDGGTGASDAESARQNIGAAAADHKHNASDISGGVIPVANGGTGATDAAGARQNLGAATVRDNIVLVDNLGGFGTSTDAGSWWKVWNIADESGNFPLALLPSQNGTQALGNNEYRIKIVYANEYSGGKWHGDAVEVNRGGTGATDAATARNNLGITPANIGASATGHKHTKAEITDFPSSMPASDVYPWAKAASKPVYSAGEVGAVPSAGGNVTGWLDFGNVTRGLRWESANGTAWELRPYVAGNIFQIVVTPPGEATFGALTINADGTPNFARALPITSGGTGATTKKAARKNLGAEIQCGVANDVGTSGVQITFAEAFSGVPVVTATGGSENASVYVRDITTTGFLLASGVGNNDNVQWQAIYMSN